MILAARLDVKNQYVWVPCSVRRPGTEIVHNFGELGKHFLFVSRRKNLLQDVLQIVKVKTVQIMDCFYANLVKDRDVGVVLQCMLVAPLFERGDCLLCVFRKF